MTRNDRRGQQKACSISLFGSYSYYSYLQTMSSFKFYNFKVFIHIGQSDQKPSPPLSLKLKLSPSITLHGAVREVSRQQGIEGALKILCIECCGVSLKAFLDDEDATLADLDDVSTPIGTGAAIVTKVAILSIKRLGLFPF